jgi:hypothetical protein
VRTHENGAANTFPHSILNFDEENAKTFFHFISSSLSAAAFFLSRSRLIANSHSHSLGAMENLWNFRNEIDHIITFSEDEECGIFLVINHKQETAESQMEQQPKFRYADELCGTR